MGLVLTSISFVRFLSYHELEICLLYGRRIIDSCLAIMFATQPTLSLNHSIAFVLCMTIQV